MYSIIWLIGIVGYFFLGNAWGLTWWQGVLLLLIGTVVHSCGIEQNKVNKLDQLRRKWAAEHKI